IPCLLLPRKPLRAHHLAIDDFADAGQEFSPHHCDCKIGVEDLDKFVFYACLFLSEPMFVLMELAHALHATPSHCSECLHQRVALLSDSLRLAFERGPVLCQWLQTSYDLLDLSLDTGQGRVLDLFDPAPALRRVVQQVLLEVAEDLNSKNPFNTRLDLLRHVPTGELLHSLAVEEEELCEVPRKKALGDEPAEKVLTILASGPESWDLHRLLVRSREDLNIFLAPSVTAVTGEVPTSLYSKSLVSLLEDHLDRNGVSALVERLCVEPALEEFVIGTVRVPVRIRNGAREDAHRIAPVKPQYECFEQACLPEPIFRTDEADVFGLRGGRELHGCICERLPVP